MSTPEEASCCFTATATRSYTESAGTRHVNFKCLAARFFANAASRENRRADVDSAQCFGGTGPLDGIPRPFNASLTSASRSIAALNSFLISADRKMDAVGLNTIMY